MSINKTTSVSKKTEGYPLKELLKGHFLWAESASLDMLSTVAACRVLGASSGFFFFARFMKWEAKRS